MSGQFIPQVNIFQGIEGPKMSTSLAPLRLEPMSENSAVNFKNTMQNLVSELNQTASAPDKVMQDAITGNGADIHDVMIAMSKAEMSVNIATTVTTKIIQAYDKVMSIQV